MQIQEHQIHPFPPLFNKDSTKLILGSFPSIKSRESAFFYGHQQNRFWPMISAVFHESTPKTIEEKTHFILNHHLALWDTIGSCSIAGSSDSSITDVIPNDISEILNYAQIQKIICNGSTSYKYFLKYHSDIKIPVVCLPSTSPANAAWSLERLVKAWQEQLIP